MLCQWSVRLALLIVALAIPSFAPAAEPEEGFTVLFNGTSLDGWHVMNGGKFAVVDGVIKQDGGSGWLRSDKEYADFILRLEVRWLKPKQDSGVFLRASEEGDNWPSRRYEVQAENSQRIVHIFGAKCVRDADKAFKLLKPDQEWNSLEIKCQGTACEVKLNGEVAATAEELKSPTGYIGFQGEGGQLEWRNVRIQSLK
jgi:hypothetical protein